MNNVALNFLTDDQARELFRQEIQRFFSTQTAQKEADKKESKIVDLSGLIAARPFIGTRSTVYKKVATGDIPHSKNGKRLIFDLNAIDEWLLANNVKTAKKIEEETQKYLAQRIKKGRGRASL